MYIVQGNNIFVRQADFHPVHAALPTSTAGAHYQCRLDIEGNHVRKDSGSLNATSRFRVLGNIGNQMRVFLSEARAQCALGQQRGWIRL
jgi:hypothetical protein